MGFQHMDIPRNGKIFLWCTRTTAKRKVLHQTLFELMGTRTCSDRYCSKQLWWNSVTNGLGDRHGIHQEIGDFSVGPYREQLLK